MGKIAVARDALIVLCGPAGSGKSYFAARFFRPTQVVSSDQCREMISDNPTNQVVSPDAFRLMHQIIEYRLTYNRLTVADATHLLPSYRRPLLDMAQRCQRPIYLLLFDMDLDTCLKNNAARPRQVPPDVVVSQMEKFGRVREQLAAESYTAIYTLHPRDMSDLTIDFVRAL